jgi:hypothetical protein
MEEIKKMRLKILKEGHLEYIIKIYPKEIRSGGVNWISLPQDKDLCRAHMW